MTQVKLNQTYKVWLKSLIFLICAMVVVGGYTRLTGSGLSITEWQLFSGIFPPMSENAWIEMFQKYQQIPQYEQVNLHIALAGFKKIFWLEYIHRFLGRFLGLMFVLPGIFFLLKGVRSQKVIITSILLVLFQGLMGWYMVSSGLVHNVSVSHYRLAAHLLIAFVIFALILNELLKKNGQKKTEQRYKKTSAIWFALITLQVIYGAFVAGSDAGYFYNEFPLMGDNLYPSEFLEVSMFERFFVDKASLQFLHRFVATFTLALSLVLIFALKVQNKIFSIIFSLIFWQYALGVMTLLSVVNIHLGVLHQFVALWLFGYSYVFLRRNFSVN
jgi:cytochrome c oxidase assembly protein subunit 15